MKKHDNNRKLCLSLQKNKDKHEKTDILLDAICFAAVFMWKRQESL